MALIETKTFSSLVDDVVTRAGRRDRLFDIISYTRLTIRECEALTHFSETTIENTLTPDNDPFIWPRPENFRIIQSVRYRGIVDEQDNPIYPRETRPGRNIHFHLHGWYPSGSAIVFFGCGTSPIDIYYYTFLPILIYHPDVANRPARFLFDDRTGQTAWTYSIEYDTSPEMRLAAQNLVQHWMLSRWYDVILEGSLAKLYKVVGDERAIPTYALYKQLQSTLLASEPHDEFN